ncbi:MAG: cytochrome c biogenesis protein CcdA [Dehalococcoidales bacterium]
MENVTLLAAFGAGLVSFVTPCVLPMVPVYFASLAGPDVLEGASASRRRLFLHSLSFVLGFSLVFTLMGALVGLAGVVINPNSPVVQNMAGSLLIIFGLLMLASLKISWLNFEKRLSPSLGSSPGYLRSFLTGGIFTLAWTPCVGPILGSILTLALSSDTAWQGAYLLLTFSLGLGLPFLVVGAAFGAIRPVLRAINRYSTAIYIIGGLALVVVGIVILTGSLDWFVP